MGVHVMYYIYDIIPKDKYSGIVPEWLPVCDDITVSGGGCNYLLDDSVFSRGDSFMCILYVWHNMKLIQNDTINILYLKIYSWTQI